MPETQTTYRIATVATTSNTLTNCGGLAISVRDLSQVQIAPLSEEAPRCALRDSGPGVNRPRPFLRSNEVIRLLYSPFINPFNPSVQILAGNAEDSGAFPIVAPRNSIAFNIRHPSSPLSQNWDTPSEIRPHKPIG